MVVLLLLAGLLSAAPVAAEVDHPDRSPRVVSQSVAGRCPFDFRAGMPPAVFCVYDGVALGPEGDICGDQVKVIWTRMPADSEGTADEAREDEPAADPGVYFGVVPFSDVVLRAEVEAGSDSGANIVDYTLGEGELRIGLDGTATRRFVSAGARDVAEVLSLRLRRPVPALGPCAFTSYDGVFVGAMTLPTETGFP